MRPTVLPVLATLPLLLGATPEGAELDPPCPQEPVRVVRAHAHPPESAQLRLTDCDGRPRREALDALSVLARPGRVPRPDADELARFARTAPPARRERFVARGIRRLHPGLLTRLQQLADRFPGRAIEIVSGHRPKARRTSRHRHGRALDLRVDGVHRGEVSRWARAHLEDSGVGFYPNSVFTHIDVRHREAYWVDRSRPGEPADYAPWPVAEQEHVREQVLAWAEEALERLQAQGHEEPELAERATATATETGTASEAATTVQAGPAADRTDGECEPEAVGGLCGARGVLAAWSSVPADDGAPAGAQAPEQGGGEAPEHGRALLGADSSEARRIRDAALATLDKLAE